MRVPQWDTNTFYGGQAIGLSRFGSNPLRNTTFHCRQVEHIPAVWIPCLFLNTASSLSRDAADHSKY